jgi:hypothetical protein
MLYVRVAILDDPHGAGRRQPWGIVAEGCDKEIQSLNSLHRSNLQHIITYFPSVQIFFIGGENFIGGGVCVKIKRPEFRTLKSLRNGR